jgi:hypothetical protein
MARAELDELPDLAEPTQISREARENPFPSGALLN